MGSTIESSIVLTLVFLIIAFLISGSEALCLDGINDVKDGAAEISFQLKEKKVVSGKKIGRTDSVDISAERFNTILKGASDAYRTVYSQIKEAVSDEKED